MTYQIKDQNVTPPPPDPSRRQSASRDAAGAVAMIFLTAALIASIIAFQIL